MLNRTLIISVFVVASCGLAYELVAAALASYLLGDSVLQFSSIIGAYLFAMGIGAHLTRYIKDEDILHRFVDIELLVGLIGGLSALLLFIIFSFADAPFRMVLYAVVLLIGTVVGMEIPLVMRILNQHQAEFKEIVSRVLTFDYLGALAVSLLFPLILAPKLGMARTALLFGILNVLVAMLTIRVFRQQLQYARQLQIKASVVLLMLVTGFLFADRLTFWAEQSYFGDPVVYSKSTRYQRIVLTRWHDDVRLFLNGNLQFSSRDEHRYHEALVLPAMEMVPHAKQVLILGGGDGLAAREVLKYPAVEKITLIDLDQQMTDLFKQSATLAQLNHNSFRNPKLHIVHADAGQWLESNRQQFDVIIIDLPDPSNFSLGKLYSVPMYRMVLRHLSEHGKLVVQSTSPYFAPHAFWCVVETLKTAGAYTKPYHAYVPSFGEWGFVLAGRINDFKIPHSYQVPTRFLDQASTQDMFIFPKDMQPKQVQPNYLNTQALVSYFEQDWHQNIR